MMQNLESPKDFLEDRVGSIEWPRLVKDPMGVSICVPKVHWGRFEKKKNMEFSIKLVRWVLVDKRAFKVWAIPLTSILAKKDTNTNKI